MRPLMMSLACCVSLTFLEGAYAEGGTRSKLIEEVFEGPAGETPNPMLWGATGGHVSLDGSGSMVFDTSSEYGYQSLAATRAQQPSGDSFLSVTYENLGGAALWNMVLGFTESESPSLRNYIFVRTDLGNDLWTVDICTDGQRSYRATSVSRSTLGTWTVEWHEDQVLVYLDGTLQFDSKVDAPEEGDDWRYPECKLRPYIGGSGGQIMRLDRLVLEEVTEAAPVAK